MYDALARVKTVATGGLRDTPCTDSILNRMVSPVELPAFTSTEPAAPALPPAPTLPAELPPPAWALPPLPQPRTSPPAIQNANSDRTADRVSMRIESKKFM